MTRLLSLIFVVCLSFPTFADSASITNPVAPSGQDPWVIEKDGSYYYIYSTQGKVWVNKAAGIVEAVQYNGKPVWKPESGKAWSRDLWAPELFWIDGHWYIYVAADDCENKNHRMYVLKSKTQDALGEFELVGKVTAPSDKWAIDGTVLQHQDKLYFIWSGWEGDINVAQNIYIAEMRSPTEISSKRVLLSRPELEWELHGNPLINEGPEVLKNPQGDVFIIYSASGSWTDHYALGQLRLTGENPMEPENWQKHPDAVFSSSETVFGPGHASFITGDDDGKNWIIYHSAKKKGAGWDRDVNVKSFGWKENGAPDFGIPVTKGQQIDGLSTAH